MSSLTGLARVNRLIVALITVWCTGCAGYEPLMNAALGSDQGMVCASGSAGESAASSASASASGPETASVAVAPAPMRDGFSCACSSCYAVSPAVPAAPVVSASIPDAADWAAVQPASVTRAPLIPPPQHGA